MKIKTEKGHEKTDPEKPVFKKRLSLLKDYIREWLVNRIVIPSYLK